MTDGSHRSMIVTMVNTLNVLANARKSRGDRRPKVSRGVQMKQRGVFEKVPGSGIWWIRYFDQFGKKRREKAGSKSVAIKLYGKRKQQVLEGKKLPELFRKPSVNFTQLVDDALAYSKRNKDRKSTRLNSSHQIISYAVFCL